MGVRSVYSFSESDLTSLSNDAILSFLDKMKELGIQNIEDMKDYKIIFYEQGYFGKVWSKLRGEDEGLRMSIVKITLTNHK